MATTMFEPAVDLDPASLSEVELADALLAADRLRSQAEAVELRLLGEFDARAGYAVDGALRADLWLSRRADLSRPAASSMVRDARALRRHPDSMRACFDQGSAKVRAMVRVLHPRIEDAYREAEPVLLQTIRPLDVESTIMFAKRWAMLVDEDGREPEAAKPRVSMGRTGDALHGSFSLYGEDAALLSNALNDEADAIYRTEAQDEHLDPTERRAEALMNLVRKAMGADDRSTNPARPTVVVHMSLAELEQRAGWRLAEIDPFGAPITSAAAHRLLCDADLHRFITGPDGVVLDLGRSERLVKGHQRLAMIARDRHCTFPGCDRPPAWCHGHHIVWWEDGGGTDLANITMLCNRHHHAVHEGGFSVSRLDDGRLEFRRPDGTRLEPNARAG